LSLRPYFIDAQLNVFLVFYKFVLIEKVAGARLVVEVIVSSHLLVLLPLFLGLQLVNQAELGGVHACIRKSRVVVHNYRDVVVPNTKLLWRVLDFRLVEIPANILDFNTDFMVVSLINVVEVEDRCESPYILRRVGSSLLLRLKFRDSLSRTVDLVLNHALFQLDLFAPCRESLLQRLLLFKDIILNHDFGVFFLPLLLLNFISVLFILRIFKHLLLLRYLQSFHSRLLALFVFLQFLLHELLLRHHLFNLFVNFDLESSFFSCLLAAGCFHVLHNLRFEQRILNTLCEIHVLLIVHP
jgi:hypothetical protein